MIGNPENGYFILRAIKDEFMTMPNGLARFDQFRTIVKQSIGKIDLKQNLLACGFSDESLKKCGIN